MYCIQCCTLSQLHTGGAAVNALPCPFPALQTKGVAKCKATDTVREKGNPIIGVFALYGQFRTFYLKNFIRAKSVLKVTNSTDNIRRIRAISAE